jgi:hypothetical protein
MTHVIEMNDFNAVLDRLTEQLVHEGGQTGLQFIREGSNVLVELDESLILMLHVKKRAEFIEFDADFDDDVWYPVFGLRPDVSDIYGILMAVLDSAINCTPYNPIRFLKEPEPVLINKLPDWLVDFNKAVARALKSPDELRRTEPL